MAWSSVAERHSEDALVIKTYRERFALHAPLLSGRFDQSWLAPSYAALFADGGATPPSAASLRALVEEVSPGIYAFDLLSDAFCELLLAELGNFEASGLHVSRPNSMNNYGVVLNSIGMERTMDALQRAFDEGQPDLCPGRSNGR